MVYINEYGLKGKSFYWEKADEYDITKDELRNIGIDSNRISVHEDLIAPLLKANEQFKKLGFEIYIKDGYRSKDLYNLVYKKRVKKYGAESVNKLLNVKTMPHSTGKCVDVSLLDIKTGKELKFKDRKDGPNALFADFYKNKKDAQSLKCQKNQALLADIMKNCGFKFGSLKEYFHFEYDSQYFLNP
ncbi:MAG: M15 family metallopeptidase [Candidatus Colwellbacteria bacterium]|jgi:D-alanyl-D-alanine dipeptidase|nr:hypothetical protein [Candidatus Colwellbacteria bacterium]MDD4818926.1 M15 family metallopeptidase [Candidatus Colwellbacteria bacterium]